MNKLPASSSLSAAAAAAAAAAVINSQSDRAINHSQGLVVMSHVTWTPCGTAQNDAVIRTPQHAIKTTRQLRIRMLTDTDWACRRRADRDYIIFTVNPQFR